ncbi:TetR/AcrR family transcriptional regulator [Promicromonospora thailandica]|uniref:Transcriptional regulator, TetR family n=1 Tax=Promicromonospora thailandica TaxID=765201 RepID=A0A9X2GEU0_9MICO|nr:TetR/AcrR family transcriptional regulator [Promicromonospora thailandica]MCP2267231.1 transcriptional regulator, TetR family [Promicromonospora thailandica]BFF17460.1 TetR/AcrR family transcriptional regulator [Promicromonospora thailandica]
MDRSDPRYLRSRASILDAARSLLLSGGPGAVTHVQVATQAGVGRATVYRHWPRAEDLLGDVMETVPFPFFSEPRTPTREWLRSTVAELVDQLQLTEVRAVATTLASASVWDAAMDRRRERFTSVLRDRVASALTEAAERGEVELRVPADQAAALVLGAVHYRAVLEHARADPAVVDAAVDAVGTWSA